MFWHDIARKFSIEGLYVCSGGLDIKRFDKIPTVNSTSYFYLGKFGALFVGLSPQ